MSIETDHAENSLLELENPLSSFLTNLRGEYDWDYLMEDPKIGKLYEMGKKLNWNVSEDINWEAKMPKAASRLPSNYICEWSEPIFSESMLQDEKLLYLRECLAWGLSQTLHGEQGALLISSQLITCAPTTDVKLYAASQAFDEARHVEVFTRYIKERSMHHYPVNSFLKKVLDSLLRCECWDQKFLGMQMIIENLALENFSRLRKNVFDPTLQSLLQLVVRDEARHVTFGLEYLSGYYSDFNNDEIRQRLEFSLNMCQLISQAIIPREVWEKLNWKNGHESDFLQNTVGYRKFLDQVTNRILPHVKRVGLFSRDLDYVGIVNSNIDTPVLRTTVIAFVEKNT